MRALALQLDGTQRECSDGSGAGCSRALSLSLDARERSFNVGSGVGGSRVLALQLDARERAGSDSSGAGGLERASRAFIRLKSSEFIVHFTLHAAPRSHQSDYRTCGCTKVPSTTDRCHRSPSVARLSRGEPPRCLRTQATLHRHVTSRTYAEYVHYACFSSLPCANLGTPPKWP